MKSHAPLEFEMHVPGDVVEGAPVAVLLHGRGSHRGDLQGLRPGLPPGMVVVTPEAPHPGAPWGYGPGWAWYRYAGQDRVASETLLRSLESLDVFLDGLPGRLPVAPGPVLLGGFSQGGTTSLAYALTRPGRVAGVLNFSGFLVDDDAVPVTPASVADTPIFWGHGVADPNIPFSLAETGRARLAEAGAAMETRDYRIGHWIDAGELEDARRWMEGVVAPR
ncbi:MAG TPA: alpha/beta hydrolase-fold protein [Longimicrobiales bacterium]|nr:alpha/beta hydrolase-fold protein [Longimicrobiales bacterium]